MCIANNINMDIKIYSPSFCHESCLVGSGSFLFPLSELISSITNHSYNSRLNFSCHSVTSAYSSMFLHFQKRDLCFAHFVYILCNNNLQLTFLVFFNLLTVGELMNHNKNPLNTVINPSNENALSKVVLKSSRV